MTMHTRFLTLSTLLLVLLTACTGRRTTADTQAETDLPAICQRDPRSGRVVTGGIVSCQDSRSW